MKKIIKPEIYIRMFKTGTGDFFLLRIIQAGNHRFHILLDCGSYNFPDNLLNKLIDDISEETGGVIDLLIVTHEHIDHISGFKNAASAFKDKILFKKVWFAWTEDPSDPFAESLRKDFAKMRMAIADATNRLKSMLNGDAFRIKYQGENNYETINDLRLTFNESLDWLNELNSVNLYTEADLPDTDNYAMKNSAQTLIDKFREWGIIKKETEVEFREPGEVISDLVKGLSFYILGPPKNTRYLNNEGRPADYYKKRQKPSEFTNEWLLALEHANESATNIKPFDKKYELSSDDKFSQRYLTHETWRNIDEDWLMDVGNIAIKYERCLNNTSLAFAIETADTGNVLLFTGDAEFGNWKSWNEIKWNHSDQDGQEENSVLPNLLRKTIFYKIGHHLSHNGTPKEIGSDYFPASGLTAMASLDLDIIHPRWKNTMPCKELTANLINRCKGNIYFSGDCTRILENLAECEISIPEKYLKTIADNHLTFSGKDYVEIKIR